MTVLHCQQCHQPFRVTDDMAGSQVQCPACDQIVDVPGSDFPPAEKSTDQPSETFACPHCEGHFQLPGDFFSTMAGTEDVAVECPHCQQSVSIDPPRSHDDELNIQTQVKRRSGGKRRKSTGRKQPSPRIDIEDPDRFAPGSPRRSKPKPEDSAATDPAPSPAKSSDPEPVEIELESPTEPAPADSRASIDHLLPPRFLVEDPERLSISQSKRDHKILLPDADGGTAQIDDRIVHIQHGDEKITLLRLTPEQRARRRMITNVITILLAILCLVAAFLLLR